MPVSLEFFNFFSLENIKMIIGLISNITSCFNIRSFFKKEFRYGTRGEVNGAALGFGFAALVIAGPIVGVMGAAASAHIAANKPCKCADVTRGFGRALNSLGRLPPKKGAVRTPPTAMKPNIFDRITDRLVEGGEWTEKKLIQRHRRY